MRKVGPSRNMHRRERITCPPSRVERVTAVFLTLSAPVRPKDVQKTPGTLHEGPERYSQSRPVALKCARMSMQGLKKVQEGVKGCQRCGGRGQN